MNPFELAHRLYGRFFPETVEEWPAKLAEWNRQPAEIRVYASAHLTWLLLDVARATMHAAATGAETSAAVAEGVDGVMAFLRALTAPAAEGDASKAPAGGDAGQTHELEQARSGGEPDSPSSAPVDGGPRREPDSKARKGRKGRKGARVEDASAGKQGPPGGDLPLGDDLVAG